MVCADCQARRRATRAARCRRSMKRRVRFSHTTRMVLTPNSDPAIEAAKIVKTVSFTPRNAPIMAMSFTSPKPIPSIPRAQVNRARAVNERRADGGSKKGIEQRKQARREVAVQRNRHHPRQKLRCQIVDRDEQAEQNSEAETGQRQLVGKELGLRVGKNQSDEQEGQGAVLEHRQGWAKMPGAGQKQACGQQFEQEVARRDGLLAFAATAAQ